MERQLFMSTASAILATLLICWGGTAEGAERIYQCLNIHVVYDKKFADYYKGHQDQFGLQADNPPEDAIKAIHNQAQRFANVQGLGVRLHLLLHNITETDLSYRGRGADWFLMDVGIQVQYDSIIAIDLYMVITHGVKDNTEVNFVCRNYGLVRSQYVGNPDTTYQGARRYLFNVASALGAYNGAQDGCLQGGTGVLEGMSPNKICSHGFPRQWMPASARNYRQAMSGFRDSWCYGFVCPKTIKHSEMLHGNYKTFAKSQLPSELCITVRAIYDLRFIKYFADNKARFGLEQNSTKTAKDAIRGIFKKAQEYASLPGLGTHLKLHLEDIDATYYAYPDVYPATDIGRFFNSHKCVFGTDVDIIDAFVLFTVGNSSPENVPSYCSDDGALRATVIRDTKDTYTAARNVLFRLASGLNILSDISFCDEDEGVMQDVDYLRVYNRTAPSKWSSCSSDALANSYKDILKCPARPGNHLKCHVVYASVT